MYTKPYIPRSDAEFSPFAQQFCNAINNDPARYMMSPADGQWLMQALQRFLAALAVATNNANRTHGTIAAKQDARSILQGLIRDYSAHIRANKGIVDEDKINVGVPPGNIVRKKRRCPTTAPLLNYIGSLPGIDQLVFHDSNTTTSKMKPYGAERLELWRAYSILAGPNAEPMPKKEDAKLVGSFKKSKMLIETDLEQEACGARPTYWGRWVGFHGDVGPWSLALNTTIVARQARAEKANAKSNADVEAKPEPQTTDTMKIAA